VVPFTFGTPFTVYVDLTGAVTVFDDFGAITSSYDLETAFQFGNTVRLVGMSVTDQAGNPVHGASLTAASGAV